MTRPNLHETLMAILFSDDFSIVASALGVGWTEDVGDFGTNAASGGIAVINATGVSLATADASLQVNQYVQAWMQVPNNLNNAGLVWRFIDTSNYYYLIFDVTANVLTVFKNVGGTPTEVGTTTVVSYTGGAWHRLGVQMVGSQISVFHENLYQTNTSDPGAGEGPTFQATDTAHTVAGKSGIISSGNNATDASGPLWNDFICHDGVAETIYVDSTASSPNAFGTLASPDPDLDWALNNVGLVRGGKIKVLNTGAVPVGNAAGLFRIGHAGKFASNVGSSFPTYSGVNGGVLTPGAPNLTFEGASNVSMTILRETASAFFFELRSDCTYILFTGFDWDMTGSISSKYVQSVSTNQLGASVEHSFRVDKSIMRLGAAGFNDPEGIVVSHDGDHVGMQYVHGLVESPLHASAWIRTDDVVIGVLDIQRCVLTGNVRQAVEIIGGPALGKKWIIDHNDFIDLGNATIVTVVCVDIADGLKILGEIELKNNLCSHVGANPPSFGFRIVANAATGKCGAHHNGFFGMGTNLSLIDDDLNNAFDVDPVFSAVGSTWSWYQSRVFPGGFPIILPSNWRPTDPAYIDTADDALWGVAFDIGAIESGTLYNPGGETPGPGDAHDPTAPFDVVGGHIIPPYVVTNPVLPKEGITLAETIDVSSRWIRKLDGSVVEEIERKIEAKIIVNQMHPIITLAAGDTNIAVPFGQGFTSATYNYIKVGNQAITYSVDGTTTHHRIEAGGYASWVGSMSSLFLTNTSATDTVDVEVAIAGD